MVAALASIPALAEDEEEQNQRPRITVNAGGGQAAGDGLKIDYAEAQLQITRKGTGQLYGETDMPPNSNMLNQVALSVGSKGGNITMFTAPVFMYEDPDEDEVSSNDASDKTTVLPWSVTSEERDGGLTSVMTGVADGRTYTVTLDLDYMAPNDYFQLKYTVDVPRGNEKKVRLFHVMDTYLERNDEGPGFYRVQKCSGPMVGVDRADVGSVEALQYLAGERWSGYASEYYGAVVFGRGKWVEDEDGEEYRVPGYGPGWGTDLPNIVDDNPETDNGIGTSWNFGNDPGSYSTTSRLLFTDSLPTDCPTSTKFVNPPATYAKGTSVPITVQVSGYEGHIPTGEVEIKDGDKTLCKGLVDGSGRMTCNVNLTGDSVDLKAYFSGTGKNADSISDLHSMVSDDAKVSVTSISPAKGSTAGGEVVTIKGENFADGAKVTIGGVKCTDVKVVDSQTIVCTTGKRKAGKVDVVVTNPNGSSDRLKDAYTYSAKAPSPQVYPNTVQPGSVTTKPKGKAKNKRTVSLRGTTKRQKTKVYIYRADRPGGRATLVKVVPSKQHIWRSSNTPMGNRKSAVFCVRANTQRGPWINTIRVPQKSTDKSSKSSVAGEVRFLTCPR